MAAARATRGRSTYELMASDVLAVMDALHVEKAGLVGWSDGACTGLILAAKAPERVAGVFFFGCNMDPSGVKKFEPNPILERCFARHEKDYALLSATPDQFKEFFDAVGLMQRTQPDYSAHDLNEIRVPVVIVHSEHDEFIKPEHAEYLARSIPNAELLVLRGEPFRAAAEAGAIQQRNAGIPQQGFPFFGCGWAPYGVTSTRRRVTQAYGFADGFHDVRSLCCKTLSSNGYRLIASRANGEFPPYLYESP